MSVTLLCYTQQTYAIEQTHNHTDDTALAASSSLNDQTTSTAHLPVVYILTVDLIRFSQK